MFNIIFYFKIILYIYKTSDLHINCNIKILIKLNIRKYSSYYIKIIYIYTFLIINYKIILKKIDY